MVKRILLIFLLSGNTFGLIRNYEGSKNLEEAKIHCPSHARDRSLVDRDRAVEYYLLYLEEYPDSINRVKVLAHIGVLYAQYKNEERKVYPDKDLARKYFEKAIETAPDFICYETIAARTNLSSMAEVGEKRFKKRFETCKWLHSITADQTRASVELEVQHLKNIRIVHDTVPLNRKSEINEDVVNFESEMREKQIKKFIKRLNGIIEAIKGSAETNLIHAAYATDNPEASFRMIISEFENSEIAEKAQQELAEYSPKKNKKVRGKTGSGEKDADIKGIFIPKINTALKDGEVFIFDLASSTLVSTNFDVGIDSKQFMKD